MFPLNRPFRQTLATLVQCVFTVVPVAEIVQTVAAPEDADEELRHLFEAIRSRPS
jgi:hypothetical protein